MSPVEKHPSKSANETENDDGERDRTQQALYVSGMQEGYVARFHEAGQGLVREL